ncbi:hypothetical protein SASPL_155010 [Salvia splendens]|uniref:Protein kinase domain-containing protein n=1 Tax=Salvia splendens TaxID=180675 RepID=A0A8X8W134_SALSN|nr:hypothetical protein SASPL_155010 [Salvia splendens]
MKMGVSILEFLAALATALLLGSSLALSPDGLTLLEVKASLNDSNNFLSNWEDIDESPCNWTGIACSPHDQRVISMALHQNSLHGSIPNEIAQCSELRALYLRANYFQGGIPSTIGNVSMLTILDLSSNTLKGAIPSSLGRLTRLAYLNLSSNFLSGEIPDVGVLSKFGSKSFIGNLDLCGQLVNKPCRTSLGFPAVFPHAESDEATGSTVHKRSSHYIKGIVIGAVSMLGVGIIFLLGFLWVWLLTKKERAAKTYTEVKKQVHQEGRAKLITFHGDLPYPSCELVEKIESLEEEDVVGAGGFGTVYRMVMNDCGTFAVKKIDGTRQGSDQVFEREIEILGSVKHRNLVNLRGYCRLPTARLLIYDYLAMGSLDYFLHGIALLNRVEDIVDRRCRDVTMETVEVLVEIAARCTDADPEARPTMQQVLQLLEREVISPCLSDYESYSDKC